MTIDRVPNILWLTNLPAPYRFPIWDHMADFVTLKVVFLLKKKNWRNWPEPVNKNWNYNYLSLNSIQLFEYDVIPSVRGVRRILKNIDIAIIGGWESPIYIRTILKAKKKKIKIIQFYESNSETHIFAKGPIAHIRKWIFSKPDFFVTISKSSKETLLALGIAPEKIVTLFNPADVHWFYEHSREMSYIPTPGHRFLYVGQLIQRKNIARLIEAFALVRTEFDILTVAGEGNEVNALKKMTNELGISEFVKFIGHKNQSELAQIYGQHSTLILPSTNEVWGLVVNEALACGMQVIVSEKCGVADLVKGMDGVFLCEPTISSISEGLYWAKRNWRGFIKNPKILEYNPKTFAEKLISLLTTPNG